MKKNLIWFFILIGLSVGSFFIGRHGRPISRDPETRIVHDTLVFQELVHDTIVRTNYVTRWLPAVHDTTEVRDTAYLRDSVQVIVPIETKVYHKEDVYYAEISGYEASLDYLEVYPRTEYVTQVVKKQPMFTFGPQIGYGASKDGLTPFFGIGVQFNILTLSH